ncbi:MAG: M48 family metalloprotease, partial [Candidatus Ranarchaeia archaeon]
YSMLLSSAFGRRNDRSSGTVVIGLASMVLYWVLTLFILYLSRLREYFADHHSVMIVENGSSNLSEALASIQYSTGKFKMNRRDKSGFQSLRTMFISDPGKAESDYSEISRMKAVTVNQSLVNKLLKKEITTADRIAELFSTHPNIIKRLKALQELD